MIRTITLGSEVSVLLPEKSTWLAEVEMEGHWSSGGVVSASSSSVHKLRVWPQGRVAGRVKLEGAERPPREISVAFWSPPGTAQVAGISRTEIECPLDLEGWWSCEAPATTLDVRVRAPGFVPHYRWDVSVEAEATRQLGPMLLVRGASLAGHVEVADDGQLIPGKGTVRLLPRTAGGGADQLSSRITTTGLSRKIGASGFFQLDGARPGSYVVEVEHPGFAPTRRFPVEIQLDRETYLDAPLVLRRPVTLELSLSPARDWLKEPWQVQVLRSSEHSASFDQRPVYSGPAGENGLIRIPEQAPGTFMIQVSDSVGSRFFFDPYVEVTGPEDATRIVEIELTDVAGTLSLGDRPLSATLWFGGERGAVAVRMDSDSEGRFLGLLPKAGAWKVEVTATDPELGVEVEVEVRADRDVEIRLPDTEVFGRVINEAGSPVPRARVTLSTARGLSSSVRVNESGELMFKGIAEGPAELSARLRDGENLRFSDTVLVTVQESFAAGPIDLVLKHATRPLTGRILSQRGPVAGANVHLAPLDPPTGPRATTRTGLDGRFRARAPTTASSAQVTVTAPGLALTSFVVPTTGEDDAGEVELYLLEGGSTLDVAWPEAAVAEIRGGRITLLQDGRYLDGHILYQWARGHGETPDSATLRLPNMMPGDYRLCLHDPRQATAQLEPGVHWLETLAECTHGYLGFGQSLSLELDLRD